MDERVVPKDHVDSNYKLAYDGFLSKVSGFINSRKKDDEYFDGFEQNPLVLSCS